MEVSGGGVFSWAIALFFCVILAYIVPVFQFVTQRTEEALDELEPSLGLSRDGFVRLRTSIGSKSLGWLTINTSLAVMFWLIQSWAMSGGFDEMTTSLTGSVSGFIVSVIPLFIWLTLMCTTHALVDNARLFRRLAKDIQVDLLDPEKLMPFGRMAVSSTLVIIGAQASFSLMWLGGGVSLWTTLPGLIPTTASVIYLLVAPVWPIHKAVRAEKFIQLSRIHKQLMALKDCGDDSIEQQAQNFAPLLSYRREISRTPEWPFNLPALARLSVYIVIVPLTWIGAALIENVVDVFIT